MKSNSHDTGGAQAYRTGNALENYMEHMLRSAKYFESKSGKSQLFSNRELIDTKHYAKQVVIGESIYGTKVRCDFLIVNGKKFPKGLVVECKWQQTPGSVDAEYPFTVLNIDKLGIPTIILIDGQGYSKKAVEWLRGQVGQIKPLLGVYNMVEFQTMANKDFL